MPGQWPGKGLEEGRLFFFLAYFSELLRQLAEQLHDFGEAVTHLV